MRDVREALNLDTLGSTEQPRDTRLWTLEGDPAKVHLGPALFPGTMVRVIPVVEAEQRVQAVKEHTDKIDAALTQKRAEADKLRAALEDLVDRQHDYPTDVSRRAPEWAAAFDRARRILAE